MNMIRILVVDDNSLVRFALRVLLERELGVALTGEAANGREGLRLVQQLKPDAVLLDSSLPDIGGADAVRQFSEACPSSKVLLLSCRDDDEPVEQAFAAGVFGYILKETATADLTSALQALRKGREYCSPSIELQSRSESGESELTLATQRDHLSQHIVATHCVA